MADTGYAYVTRGGGFITVVDPASGSVVDSVDLTSMLYTDTAFGTFGKMTEAILSGEKLYVLMSYCFMGALAPPRVIKVDIRTGLIDTSTDLSYDNAEFLDTLNGVLHVVSAGCVTQSSAGGIEHVAMQPLEDLGVHIDKAQFNGRVGDFVLIDNDHAFINLHDDQLEFIGEVIPFDPVGIPAWGTKLPAFTRATCLAYDGSRLWVGDNGDSTQTIVRVDPSTNAPDLPPIEVPGRPAQVLHIR
jgi:hypothetical protein